MVFAVGNKQSDLSSTKVLMIRALLTCAGLVAIWAAFLWVVNLFQADYALHFPENEWERQTPEEAGFSSEKLEKFVNLVKGHGCIIYNGRMIKDWGDCSARVDIASSAKPIYAHFVIKALEDGLIGSLDDHIVDWAHELAGLNEALGYKDRKITWRHLLQQTSGYGLVEPPGEAFAYNDFQTGLMLWTLVRRVYACGYDGGDEVLIGDLLDKYLEFQDKPTMYRSTSRPGRIRMSARDFARFGLLYLAKGRWKKETLISRGHVRRLLHSPLPLDMPRTSGKKAERAPDIPTIGGGRDQKGHMGAYSCFWWVNHKTEDGSYLFPSAPKKTFSALGWGGRYAMIAIPEYKLVVVWLNGFPGRILIPLDTTGRKDLDKALKLLLDARVEEK